MTEIKCDAQKNKIRFAIVGSGYRASFYIRIAKYYSNKYELVGVLCRSSEKAELIHNRYDVNAVTDENIIRGSEPSFVVVCVNKASIAEVSAYWRSLEFTVLCETPVGLNLDDLLKVYSTRQEGGRLVVAEQYCYYPTYRKIIETVKSGKIGDILSAYVSLAHEYHGASLIRAMLKEDVSAKVKIRSRSYNLPVTRTKDRYNTYTDGEIIMQKRVLSSFEYESGKFAEYDFDSQQYRSPIRTNSVRITGTRGEIAGNKLYYLDENNNPVEEILFNDLQDAVSSAEPGQLSEDETAIEYLMECAYNVSVGDEKWLEWQESNLRNALQDAYTMILMQEADDIWKEPDIMPWQITD